MIMGEKQVSPTWGCLCSYWRKRKTETSLRALFQALEKGFGGKSWFGITAKYIHQHSALVPKATQKMFFLIVSKLYFTFYLLGMPKWTKGNKPHTHNLHLPVNSVVLHFTETFFHWIILYMNLHISEGLFKCE